MSETRPPFVHLHLPLPDRAGDLPPRARSAGGLLFRDPVEVVSAVTSPEVRPALRRLEAAAGEGLWAAGWIGYEAWSGLEPHAGTRAAGERPLLRFGLFTEPVPTPPPDGAPRAPDAPSTAPDASAPEIGPWAAEWDERDHARRVDAIRRGIGRGDVYQVNLTFRLRSRVTGSPDAVYRRLLRAQGRSYGGHVALGGRHVLSASPELFLLRRGRILETRPMKGTIGRGRWPSEDRARAAALARSEKDRAENAMIVDLLRNDLGRVCTFGSVEVPSAFRVESYRTVHQMTSTVRGRLREDADLERIFEALFPCGSVTGAPKLAAGEFIRRLESSPREAYCGAVGMIVPGGDLVFNVAIRTLQWEVGTGDAVYGTGGGVTWDSSPRGEYAEALRKAEVLRTPPPDFDLLETFRLENGRPRRLDRHLARLAGSAEYWDFDLDPVAVRRAVDRAAGGWPAGVHRVRLLLTPAGEVRVRCETFGGPREPVKRPLRMAIDPDPVDPDDPLLYHKTTLRAPYRERRERRSDLHDVVLTNGRGEITETTRANLVAEIDGELLTPPVGCGLLPGVLRGLAIEGGRVRESVLTTDDVRRASRLWALSSLRGWLEVELEEA